MDDLNSIREEIRKTRNILKQLEGVYKTSVDELQKKRVFGEIREVKKRLRDLLKIVEGVPFGLNGTEKSEDKNSNYKILNKIEVKRYHPEHSDYEMDALISYMDYFENNYLSILSEYYIKLDFNNSLKRDSYYTKFMEIKKILKEYYYELDIVYNENFNTIAAHRDRSVLYKIRQRLMIELDRFFKDLKNFLGFLIDDYKTGGNVILNPDGEISYSDFEEKKKLDGYPVVKALEEIKCFSEEIIRFLSIPAM